VRTDAFITLYRILKKKKKNPWTTAEVSFRKPTWARIIIISYLGGGFPPE
jgi:hypothetical protein